jgi:glycosyltransferase involved in cell wall biosynthesis
MSQRAYARGTARATGVPAAKRRARRDLCEHARVRVALDATPLLGIRTGIGHYVAHLAAALAKEPDLEVVLTAFTWRGQSELRGIQLDLSETGDGADMGDDESDDSDADRAAETSEYRVHSRRAPARLLRLAWSRGRIPPVEMFSGAVDVFHATNFVLPPTRRAAGVVTIHDLGFVLHAETVDRTSLAYQRLVPRALERARVILTPSQAAADDLVQVYKTDRDRIVVTPLGVDPVWAATTPPSPQWLEAHEIPPRYLLFIGTLEPRKNVPHLIAAHALLRREEPNTPPLVLAGAAGWGDVEFNPDDVVWPGYLPQGDLRRLTAGAAALVLPSRYEGFGLPALEALACGVPVVASDIPVLREVTGGLAQYVPVGDVEALAATLRITLDADDSGRDERRAWAATFTWERCATQTLAAYRRALGLAKTQ